MLKKVPARKAESRAVGGSAVKALNQAPSETLRAKRIHLLARIRFLFRICSPDFHSPFRDNSVFSVFLLSLASPRRIRDHGFATASAPPHSVLGLRPWPLQWCVSRNTPVSGMATVADTLLSGQPRPRSQRIRWVGLKCKRISTLTDRRQAVEQKVGVFGGGQWMTARTLPPGFARLRRNFQPSSGIQL